MKKLTFFITILMMGINSNAQNIGINTDGSTPNSKALLDIKTPASGGFGLLIPRMTHANKPAALGAGEESMLIYSTDGDGTYGAGFYYWKNSASAWMPLFSSDKGWGLFGNSGTTAGTNYIGTSDAVDLVFKTNANEQMRINTSGYLGINETNPTGAYLVISSANSGVDGLKITHTSGSAGSVYYGANGSLSNAAYTNATGYLAYHNSFNKTYGIYGTGGDLAGYFDGLVGINSISTDLPAHDVEIRNNSAANPVQLLLRRTTQATVANTDMVKVDFGDSYNATAQAQIKVIRDAASTNASDIPTAMIFSTIADGTSTLSEGMRLTNAGFLGIGTTSPQQSLHVADDIIVGGGQGSTMDGNTEHVKFWAQSKVWNVGVVNDALTSNSDFFISQTDGTNDGTFDINPNGNIGINTITQTHKLEVINSTTTTDIGAVYGYISNTTNAYGVLGYNTNDIDAVVKQIGVYGNSGTGDIAVAGRFSSTKFGYIGSSAYGIYGRNDNGAGTYGGYFVGNVHVTGTLSKSAGTFKIDHPQDPENKYLIHSFVESPDMMNIYNGNVTTDSNGYATVTLPDYFTSLNIDYRYQLTVLGKFAQAIVSKKIDNNQFIIQTSEPNTEVSWQVTGIRNDPYAKENRIIPVVEKEEENKGKYLNPEVYKQPDSKGIGYHFSPDN